MNILEILKETTIQYSLFDLLQHKLSDFLVDEILKIDSSFQNEKIIRKEVANKEDIKDLQTFLTQNKKNSLMIYIIPVWKN